MRIQWISQVVLLLLMLITAPQIALTASGQNSSENITSPSVNNTITPAVEFVSAEGIWKASLAGSEITMAVNQSGDSVSGRCKFEGANPWNGVVAGSISGKMVNIAMAAMQGNVLVSTEMIGVISSDAIQGSYTSFDSNGNGTQDSFTATKISQDISGYKPAEIAAQAPATSLATAEQPQAVQQTPTVVGQQSQTSTTIGQQSQTQKSRIKDVTELAKGIDPNIMPRHAPL